MRYLMNYKLSLTYVLNVSGFLLLQLTVNICNVIAIPLCQPE